MDHSGHENQQDRGPNKSSFFASRTNVVLLGFIAIGGFFLLTEHRAHLIPYLGYLPFLLILACPLLHLFMHGGHGGDQNTSGGSPDGRQDAPPHQH